MQSIQPATQFLEIRVNGSVQRCSTRVQDLDSGPVFLGLGLETSGLGLGIATYGLGLDTSGLELGCFLPK